MPLPDPTVDTLVNKLRMSRKPNIVVEGEQDAIIYGQLVDRLGRFNIDFLPAGCRSILLALYDKLSCYENQGDSRHKPVVFIADRDAWLFNNGIPPRYNDIIWTDGYSIENDLYEGAKPSLETLMNCDEAAEHKKVLDTIAEWFAFEVQEFLAGNTPKFATHCNQVLVNNGTTMDPDFCKLRRFRTPNQCLSKKIKTQYQSQLRGKLLFQMLVRFVNKRGRKARYNEGALYEIALNKTTHLPHPLMDNPHPLMDKLIGEIKKRISIP